MPSAIGPEAVCSPEAVTIINQAVHKLRRNHAFRNDEVEDLRQEIIARVIHKLPLYRPERQEVGAFVRVVSQSVVKMMIRERSAAKRSDGRPVLSLDLPINDNARTTPSGTVTTTDIGRRLGLETHYDEIPVELQDALELLPANQRAICDAVMTSHNMTEAARTLGLRPQRLYEVLPQIRDHLRRCGFEDFN